MSRSARSALWAAVALVAAVAVFFLAYFAGLATTTAPAETSANEPEAAQSSRADAPSAEGGPAEQSRTPDAGPQSDDANEVEIDPEEAPDFPDLARRLEDDPAALGAVDAPVVMVEFADYRCPFCGVFARDMQPQLIQDYVEPGLLRIEWRDTPIFGEESVDGAVAARAAGAQGMFWEYYDALFAYEGSGHQSLPRERLLEIAQEIGVPDLSQFESALDDEDLLTEVGMDYTESQSVGVYSTPAFLIGGTPILGAQPYEVFQEAIESELDQAGVIR